MKKKAFDLLTGILRTVFQFAYTEYLIEQNEYLRVDFSKFDSMLMSKVPVSERMHSDNEVDLILDYLHQYQEKKPMYLPAYALEMQIIMGLRRGEIPPLERADIYDNYIFLNKEQITVKKSATNPKEYCSIVHHTKTHRDRQFPISDDLKAFLERLFSVLDTYYPNSKYLFPANSDTGVITNNTVYNYYRRTCKKLNISVSRDFMKGPHSFRRNAITSFTNASGGNIVLASKIFGNSPQVADKNYYTGINMENAIELLNQRKLS